jgi:hypothetical protein
MTTTIKIQKKCIQTVLNSEGRFLHYKLVYPISFDFKLYLQEEEPDEHDFVISVPVKNKNTHRFYYAKMSENFNKIKEQQYLIMIKSSNFRIKKEQEKKSMLVNTYAHYSSLT